MRCSFCNTTAPATIDQASDEGWVPGWYEDETETCLPVCGDCVRRELTFNETHGDFERRPLAAMSIEDYGS